MTGAGGRGAGRGRRCGDGVGPAGGTLLAGALTGVAILLAACESNDHAGPVVRSVVIDTVPAGSKAITGGVVPCRWGSARGFDCDEVDLVSFLHLSDIGAGPDGPVNDIWGWTDSATGTEWALVGHIRGTSFIDLSDPENPVYAGVLPLTDGARESIWRDIKVYRDHAFIVSDAAGGHGMQVFDLTRLKDAADPPVIFEPNVVYDNIGSAHNIVINEETGFAYSVGGGDGRETCGGGLHMIDIRDPVHPVFAGCFADTSTGIFGTGYTHDAQCVVYRGPDSDHRGREICIGANETALNVADVTDKNQPFTISAASYPLVEYAHQGWFDETHEYFYMNDEGDESSGIRRTRTLVWDLRDLDDPIVVGQYRARTRATDHNLYIRGDLMYQSNYRSGLRILDISTRRSPEEVAFFDTEPGLDTPELLGSWSNYPYFGSGIVAVTSMYEGVFFLRGPASAGR